MTTREGFKKFAVIAALIGLISSFIVFAISKSVYIFIVAYLISFVFVGSNFFVMSKRNIPDNTRFMRWFAASFAVRFLGAVIAIVIGLKILNSHQILFTVSFLFSYICNSVIEIIYLHKITRTES